MLEIGSEVIQKLDSIFSEIPIYGEVIEQGFEAPCFFVKVLRTSQKKGLSRRYIKNHSVDIHYFASTNKALRVMEAQLYEKMEYLLDYKGRASHMNAEIVDGVLHFYIDYIIHFVKSKVKEEKMKKMEVASHYGNKNEDSRS